MQCAECNRLYERLGQLLRCCTMLLSPSKRCTTNSLRCSIHMGDSQQVVTSHKTDLGSFLRHLTGDHSTSDRFSSLALESANARKLQYVYPRPLLERHISKSPNHKPRGHTLSGLGFSASEMLHVNICARPAQYLATYIDFCLHGQCSEFDGFNAWNFSEIESHWFS